MLELPLSVVCIVLVSALLVLSLCHWHLARRHRQSRLALERVRGQRDAYGEQIGLRLVQRQHDVTTDRAGASIPIIKA